MHNSQSYKEIKIWNMKLACFFCFPLWEIFCFPVFNTTQGTAFHHLQASGATYLYTFYLSFMIKNIFMHKWCGLWRGWGNVSSPDIMIKFIFLLHTFIYLAHATRQWKEVTAHLDLFKRQVCACICVSNIMISFWSHLYSILLVEKPCAQI